MKNLRGALLATGIAVCASASAAQATVVFSDNFDAENGGAGAANYSAFTNWSVSPGTKVDLLHNGDAGTTGSGSYVDLGGGGAGSAVRGEMFTKQGFTYDAGDVIQIKFDASGNQRADASDKMYFGIFDPNGNTRTNAVEIVGNLSPFILPDVTGNALLGGLNAVPFQSGWFHVTLTETFTKAGTGHILFGTTDTRDIGILVDNIRMSVSSSAAPEPASWAMMIAGFGLAGTALRRRRRPLALSA